MPRLAVLAVILLILAAPTSVLAGLPLPTDTPTQEPQPTEEPTEEPQPTEEPTEEPTPGGSVATPPEATTGGGGGDPGPPPPEALDWTDVTAGSTVGTGDLGEPAHPPDPIETSFTAGVDVDAVVISEESVFDPPAPSGWVFLGQQVTITAPDATVETPHVIAFTIDASVLDGATAEAMVVFKDGASVEACTATDDSAIPDPCVALRETLDDGDLRVTVRTSTASIWTLGLAAAPAASLADSATRPPMGGLLTIVAFAFAALSVLLLAIANAVAVRRR